MKSDREQDGLVGLVRHVVAEMAVFLEQGQRQTLGARVPLFTLQYNTRGKRVGERNYYYLHGESGVGDFVTHQDKASNKFELFCFSNGEFLYKVIPTYDSNNKVVDELFYEATGNLLYRRMHEYDVRGNPIAMSLIAASGTVIDKLKYENEYDIAGNLIKVTILKWSSQGGELSFKPIMVNYRTITYF
jgi:hypothetical protein